MNLINFDGTALLGKGSEWLWMMCQFVALVITLYAIYRQLSAQRSANAFARMMTLQGEWKAREMTLMRLRTALELRYGERGRGLPVAAYWVTDFFDNLSDLHEAGSIDLREIDRSWGQTIQIWWFLLESAIDEQRVIVGNAHLHEGFKNLNSLLRQQSSKAGPPPDIDKKPAMDWLDDLIGRNTGALQLLAEIESREIPKPPTQPAPGAAAPPA